MSEQKLTMKQKKFVAEYLKTGNATEAARRAGYKGTDTTLKQVGSENLAKPYIKAMVEKANAKRDSRLELEADWELKQCIDILEECRREGDLKTAIQAVNTIGKLRGKFVNKIEIGLADNVAEQLEEL